MSTLRFELIALPPLIDKLVKLEEAERQAEHAKIRNAGMRILARYLPPDLIGQAFATTHIHRRPHEVIIGYEDGFKKAAPHLAMIGLAVIAKGDGDYDRHPWT